MKGFKSFQGGFFMNEEALVTRKQTARQLKITERTVDKLRRLGVLPWIDLTMGKTGRPIIRFQQTDIERLKGTKLGGL
jgi:hypothetical protein